MSDGSDSRFKGTCKPSGSLIRVEKNEQAPQIQNTD